MNNRRVVVRPRAQPAAPANVQRGTVSVVGQVKVKGELRGGASKEETLMERRFASDQPPATVRVGAGLTINTGNFESLRLDVSVSLPCLPSEVEDAYVQASEFVSEFLAEEQANWTSSTEQKTAARAR